MLSNLTMQAHRQEARSTFHSRISGHCSDFDFEEGVGLGMGQKPASPVRQSPAKSKRSNKTISASTLINKLLLETHQVVAQPHQTLFKRGYSNPMSLSVRLGIVLKREDKSKLDDLAKDHGACRKTDLKERLRAAIEQSNITKTPRLTSRKPSVAVKTQQPLYDLRQRTMSVLYTPQQKNGAPLVPAKHAAPVPREQKVPKKGVRLGNVEFGLGQQGRKAYIPSGALTVRTLSAQRLKSISQNRDSFFPERYPMRLKQDRQAATARAAERPKSSESRSRLQTSQTKLSSLGFQSRISFLAHGSVSREGGVGDQSLQAGKGTWGLSGGSKSQLLTNYSSVQGASLRQGTSK